MEDGGEYRSKEKAKKNSSENKENDEAKRGEHLNEEKNERVKSTVKYYSEVNHTRTINNSILQLEVLQNFGKNLFIDFQEWNSNYNKLCIRGKNKNQGYSFPTFCFLMGRTI